MIWLKVWAWLKKYWKWLLFPVGILLGILSMLGRKRIFNVVSPELVEAEKVREEAEEDKRQRIEELEQERSERLEEIERVHADTVSKLTDEQKKRVEELREDPDELNDFLLEVGKDIRG